MATPVTGGISFSRYVNITSGVEGATEIGNRSLAGLVISVNPLVPTGELISFSSASAVGTYFGTGSGEYARAQFYFSFLSKNTTQPQTLSFWFWNNDTATGSLIYGEQGITSLTSFTSITTGDFTLTLGGYTDHVTGINLSSAGSLSAVASDIQTAIRAISAGGSAWTSATVTYSNTTNSFNLVSGITGTDTVTVVAGTTTDVAGPLGWLPPNAILSNGTNAQTLSANLTQLSTTDNNFGSFCLGASSIITETNVQAAANWNGSLTPNFQYLFCWPVTGANASTWVAGINAVTGHAAVIQSPSSVTEYPEMLPMAILAATNYQAQNSVQDYEYQQANLTPSVTTDANANTYDAILVNYYGQTQVNGQYVAFFQRGTLSGGTNTTPQDIGVYCNEMWLKSAMSTAILNLFLALADIAANNQGVAQLRAIIQSVINQALFNGTISVGNPLTAAQIAAITSTTGDPTAWQKVQNLGYWVSVTFEQQVINNLTEWVAVYTLVYAKNNAIRVVDGTDALI